MKYLVINTKYKEVELGFFYKNEIISKVSIENKIISKNLIISIDKILKDNNLYLKDLDFIAANCGPAPFTTLRSVISTINGINFFLKIPLVNVNGLEALYFNYKNKDLIVILNAFGQDLYYYYNNKFGTSNYLSLLNNLNISFKEKIEFIGNGAEIYKDDILKIFKNRAEIIKVDSASLINIKDQAILKYLNKETEISLKPIYLK